MDWALIEKIVGGVFPQGSELARKPTEVASAQRYIVLSGKKGLRWIVPRNPTCGWPVLTQWRPYGATTRHLWKLLMAAYRLGQLDRTPGVGLIGIAGVDEASWEHLGWHETEPPVPVIYVGTPGPHRKAVAGLVSSESANLLAVCKTPLGDRAGEAICGESAILDLLKLEKPGIAPSSLFIDREAGIATQEPVAGKPSGRRLQDAHTDWLLGMRLRGESITLRETRRSLAQEIENLETKGGKPGAVLQRALDEIDDTTALPAVWVHGDFAPWNLKRMPDGSIRAIDWEAAVRGGLPFFDLVHFRTMQAFLFGERELFSRRFLRQLSRYADMCKIPTHLIGKSVLACMLFDLARCYRDGADARADFLLKGLQTVPDASQ